MRTLGLVALVGLLIGASGCFYAEETYRPPRVVSEEVSMKRRPGEVVPVAAADGERLHYRVVWRQQCEERRVAHVEYDKSKRIRAVGDLPGGRLGLLFLPFTLGSLVVAAAQTAGGVERHVEESSRLVDCSRPIPGLRVVAQLPSGRELRAVTDGGGMASFDVPTDEREGTATFWVQNGNVWPVSVRLKRPGAAIVQAPVAQPPPRPRVPQALDSELPR